MYMLAETILILARVGTAAGGARTPPPSPPGTKCCNGGVDPARCSGNGTGMGGLCSIGVGCECTGAGWMPAAWAPEVAAADRLVGSPDEPGPAVANGYVGAWVPRGLPGSAGPAYSGREFVKGVDNGAALLPHSNDSGAGPDHTVGLAPLGSWTVTAFVAALGGAPAKATASALDLRRAAYEVATPMPPEAHAREKGAGERSHCVQRTYAHRSLQHLLITEFVCENHDASKPLSVVLKQRHCPDGIAQSAFTPYAPLCPKTDASKNHGSEMGYVRVDVPSGMPGVACSRSTMAANESPSLPPAVVGECHSDVPRSGLQVAVPPGQARLFSLISARYSTMDNGVAIHADGTATLNHNANRDPVALAKAAWSSASASSTSLFAQHVAAIALLNTPGIEVSGNLELARVVNSSLYSLLGGFREDSPYAMAPEGLVSARYSGYAFWDQETWMLPVYLAFWPKQAEAALQYRVDRIPTARVNAHTPVFPGAAQHRGLRFPVSSAITGIEQCDGSTEDHVQGDIATAFRQYYFSTEDTEWLRTAGFPMINGLAQYYASRFKLGADGKLHVYNTTGPDEYNANVMDSTYSNAVGIMALRSAYELAAAAGAVPNTTYERLAALVYLPYDVERDYHPEFEGWSTSTHGGLIKQADTVLMQYPLNFPMNVSTRRNDMRIFDAATDVKGVAMGWAVISLIHKDLGDADKAAHFFRVAYNTTSPPFYEWHEGFGQEGSSAQGAPNFVTGAGGWLQTVVNGFGGLRWERPGVLTLHDPQPLPNSTELRLRGVSFLGARLDIVATARGWTVALSSRAMGRTDGVPPALELVMEAGTDGAANSVRLTHTPVARKRGMVGLVRRVSHQAVVDLLYS